MPYIGKKPADIIATVIDTTTGTFSGDLTVDTNTLYVDSANNRVGLGTVSPSAKLHIDAGASTEALRVEGSGSYIAYLNTTNSQSLGFIQGNDTSLTIAAQGSGNTSSVNFISGGSERARIDSSGNLLVGTTSSSSSTAGIKLTAAGTATFVRSGVQPVYVNRLTSDGDLAVFAKDGTTVGSIGTAATDIYIGTTDTGIRFNDAVNGVLPYNTSTGQTDATLDLGFSTVRWRNLYLSGGVYLGGTGSANYLSDYEEGTITITGGSYLFNGSGEVAFESTVNELSYIKIGDMVSIQGRLQVATVTGTPTGSYLYLTGALPFTSADLTDQAGRTAVNIGLSNPTIATIETAAGVILENSNILYIYLTTASGNQVSNMATGANFYINGTYRTS